jgi:hypothetical protein
LIEQPVGKGVIRLLTSGWQPVESQIALSASKFVPLMEEMVRRKDAIVVGSQYVVNDAIALPKVDSGTIQIKDSAGKTSQIASNTAFTGADKPGIYHLLANGQDVPLAVNVAPEESRTVPQVAEDLEQWGVKFTNAELEKSLAEKEKFLRNSELENRQKSWRWLLISVLGLLAVETALAGRLSRSAIKERTAT